MKPRRNKTTKWIWIDGEGFLTLLFLRYIAFDLLFCRQGFHHKHSVDQLRERLTEQPLHCCLHVKKVVPCRILDLFIGYLG